ncbi:MAG TPA: PSD1 and planctomycete cytochrome C domain-containing protein [Blastocatellia bacterium]
MLDSREGMLKGGNSGNAVIIPGDPDGSLLIKAIRYNDSKLQMPPTGQLPAEQIKDFETWVKMGAPDPRIAGASTQSNWQPYDFSEARKFWSFQPVKDPPLPEVNNKAWVRSPIDRFILAKLESKGLKPVGDADKRTLIRRATFDLTGLPTTPDEIDAFMNDASPKAFEKVIDRLLASPQYGERWGRHWLDVVRYADTAGCNSDFPISAAYKYRNYVIKSFNEDKPYDRFIREQIAGDLLPSKSDAEKYEHIIATGYLAISRRFGSRTKEFNLTIDDTIDNLSKTFLGLSVSCARCHNHKFDPIPARDYYGLYGIFNSSRYSFPGTEIYPHPGDMVALASGEQAERFYKWQRELSAIDDKKEYLTVERGAAARNKANREKQQKEAAQQASATQVKSIDKQPNDQSGLGGQKAASKSEQKIELHPPGELRPADYDRDAVNSSKASKSTRLPEEVLAESDEIRARVADLSEHAPKLEKAYAVVEGLPANARIHRKGEPKDLGDEVPRGFLTILGGQQLPADNKGSGRDYLANWIADAKNPLTARVIVNRIWQYHFGKGIVPTPNDFGSRGAAPTHPELLDYLGTQLIKSGWSLKAMHRMIMLSRAYQLAATDDAHNTEVDANNDLLWRFSRRRLSAEEIRDAMLATSGSLDRTMGEAHPFPPESEWHYTQHNQFFAVYDNNRRSVYLMQQRMKKHPLMEVFDGPDTNYITSPRPLSTTPLQALFLMNSPFVHQQADQFAVRVGMAYDTLAQRINYAFLLAYGRPAKPAEVREATDYIQKVRQELQEVKTPMDQLTRAALASFLRVVLASDEFLYVD